ncbi:O-antigen ligase family protein [Pseudomonas putida]|nr:O-antigen ligase family protein [Pseudomonas putida]
MLHVSQVFMVRALLFLCMLAVVLVGHVELVLPEIQKDFRIIFIAVLFVCVSFVFILDFAKSGGMHFVVFCVLFSVFYSFGVSVATGGIISGLSPLLRLLTFAFMVSIIYKFMLKEEQKANRYISNFFLLSSILVVLQTVSDLFMMRYTFMNGGIRYFGSVGSPIGFAVSAFTLLAGVLYYWVRSGSVLSFVISVALLWVIVMTGTRSIAFFALCLVWFACAVCLKKWRRYIFILGTPLLGVVVMLLLSGSGFVSRLENTYNSGTLDNSSSFRVFILETYFSNIQPMQAIFGFGLGGFHQWFLDRTGIENVAPHFEFLWVLSEFGVLGVLIYVLSAFWLLYKFLKKRRCDSSLWFAFVAIGCMHQVFLQVANPFYFYQFYLTYAVLLGILLSRLNSNQSFFERAHQDDK